jgi:HK97 gp10 family phage protein
MSFKQNVSQEWNGKDVKLRGRKVVNKGAFETGLIVEGQARELAAKQTGRLQGSITTQAKTEGRQARKPAEKSDVIGKPTQDNVVYVGTAVEYAPYVEFGTKHSNAQPFLRPALDLAKGKTLDILEKEGKKYFGNYLRRPK